MESVKNAFEAAKELNRYTKKHVTLFGLISSFILVTAIIFLFIWIAVVSLTQSIVLGIVLSFTVTTFTVLVFLSVAEKILLRIIPKKKARYLSRLRLERLYSLDNDDFYLLAFNTIKRKTGEDAFERRGLLFDNGRAVAVFSAKPGKQASLDVIKMAEKIGRNKLIAVIAAKDTKNVIRAFGKKVTIVTDNDIADNSEELMYPEICKKQKIDKNEIFTKSVAKRLIKSGAMLVLLSLITGIKGVFIKMAAVSLICGIALYAFCRFRQEK